MSFVEVSEKSDFPIQNLPYGVFSVQDVSRILGVLGGVPKYLFHNDISIFMYCSLYKAV